MSRLCFALIYSGMLLPYLLFPAPADALWFVPSVGCALGVQW